MLKPGITLYLEKTVSQKDTATAFGSGTVDVFATPSMIALMEETAHKSVMPYLDSKNTTVGFEVNIKHFKAVQVGEEVVSSSILTEVNKRKLTFSVKVLHDGETVGKGTHVRYVVDKAQFV